VKGLCIFGNYTRDYFPEVKQRDKKSCEVFLNLVTDMKMII